jgi:hypothetical protein
VWPPKGAKRTNGAEFLASGVASRLGSWTISTIALAGTCFGWGWMYGGNKGHRKKGGSPHDGVSGLLLSRSIGTSNSG